MTKMELRLAVAKKAHITKKIASEVMEVTFNIIADCLRRGEKVVVTGLGTFIIFRVKDKEILPFGDESKRHIVAAHSKVLFRPAKPLRRDVWKYDKKIEK